MDRQPHRYNRSCQSQQLQEQNYQSCDKQHHQQYEQRQHEEHYRMYEQQQMSSSSQSSSDDEEKFQSPEEFYRGSNQQSSNSHFLPSVRKFLSKPNPLMNKIQFTPYHPKCYYPRQLVKLPKCLRDFSCIMAEKNNMNSLSQAVHGQQKLRKEVIDVLYKRDKKIVNQQNRLNLVTLQEYYQTKQPIYERYSAQEMKLEQTKLKLRYFATYVLDMAKILRKQMKFQEKNEHINTQANIEKYQPEIKPRPASVSRSGNFNIREPKSIQTTLPICQFSQLQKHNHTNQSNRKSSAKIEFESNFQSGNLFRVYQKQFSEYDLILQNDINTKGNTQWFFFSVKNVPKNTTVKFNIVNMSKTASLFNVGMKPYVFSMMRYEKRKVGWLREGLKVSYKQSQYHKKESSKRPYYVLSFQYKFLYDGDVVYFSHSIPYTLTDLSQFLNARLKDKNLHKLIKLKNVGLTLGANQVDLIQITNTEFMNKSRKSVWIIARQHPGETTSGFMLEGIIDFLLQKSDQAMTLLNNFIFKIVPMVNVDGVVHGNSRAQFIGHDPNRRWLSAHKLHNPIIYSIKHYIERQKDNIELFLDLHSHSRKLGTFFYGNTLQSNTAATRMYPLTVCKNDPRFTFKGCRFNGGSNLAARAALFNTVKTPLIYTVQCSFYGYQVDDFRIIQYMPHDYKQMGSNLMKGFLKYEISKNSIALKLTQSIITITSLQQQQLNMMQMNDQQLDRQSVGSDEDPTEDEYNQKQFKKLITVKNNKKKKKKKKVQEPEKKTKPLKEEEPKKLPKPKVNNSESHYKEYFSGRLNALFKRDKIIDTINYCPPKKVMVSHAVQVNPRELQQVPNSYRRDSAVSPAGSSGYESVLTQRKNQPQAQQLIYNKLGGLPMKQVNMAPNNLMVVGHKVEQISVFGNTVGIQVSENKQIFTSRFEQCPQVGRKTFSVRQRVSSYLQVKQNNFLQRGDCMTKNFFSRR